MRRPVGEELPRRVVGVDDAVQDGIGRLIRAGRVRVIRPPLDHAQGGPEEREIRREAWYEPPDLLVSNIKVSA